MNHYYQTLFDYVAEVLILPESDKDMIRRYFSPVFVPKNTIFEPAGTIPQYHNFIVSGFMRNFHVDNDGNEVTTDLNDGPRYFTSYFHFMNQTISNENLHCITDCELLRISREDVEKGAVQSITQKDFTIQILQKLLEEDRQRIYDIAHLTAEQRYNKFALAKPKIVVNVPLNYIASYLGITNRHLSRLRKIH
jgi:CRP/FNR family transcriptional regulator, anaerobic regulatory protein